MSRWNETGGKLRSENGWTVLPINQAGVALLGLVFHLSSFLSLSLSLCLLCTARLLSFPRWSWTHAAARRPTFSIAGKESGGSIDRSKRSYIAVRTYVRTFPATQRATSDRGVSRKRGFRLDSTEERTDTRADTMGQSIIRNDSNYIAPMSLQIYIFASKRLRRSETQLCRTGYFATSGTCILFFEFLTTVYDTMCSSLKNTLRDCVVRYEYQSKTDRYFEKERMSNWRTIPLWSSIKSNRE